jgi:hypothetical protein
LLMAAVGHGLILPTSSCVHLRNLFPIWRHGFAECMQPEVMASERLGLLPGAKLPVPIGVLLSYRYQSGAGAAPTEQSMLMDKIISRRHQPLQPLSSRADHHDPPSGRRHLDGRGHRSDQDAPVLDANDSSARHTVGSISGCEAFEREGEQWRLRCR